MCLPAPMIAAIVLAAGESRRMGQLKLAMPLAGTPVLCHVVNALMAAPVAEIVVVVGHCAEDVRTLLRDAPVRIVENPRYHEGMLSSVRAGLNGLSAKPEAVVVALGDQPAIQSAWVKALIESFRKAAGGIHVPAIARGSSDGRIAANGPQAGRRGHPLLFSSEYVPDVLTRFDDAGLRGLLDAYPDAVYEVLIDDAGILEDLDTPEDFAQAVRRRGERG